jgi:cell division protease FtsH
MAQEPSERRRPTSPAPEGPKWRIEGARPGTERPAGSPMGRFPGRRWLLWLLLGLLALNIFGASLIPDGPKRIRVSYDRFVTEIDAGNVTEVRSRDRTVQGSFKKEVTVKDDGGSQNGKFFKVEIPTWQNTDKLAEKIDAQKDLQQNADPVDEPRSGWETLLFSFGPTLLIFGLIFWFMRRAAAGAGGGLMGIGRSKAKRYEPPEGGRVTFDDVAGIEEAEEELVEVVDFLKNPDRYRRLGGQIPRGVLLSGPPGTGKTLLARAVAGEADVPFFSLSASEFVEMIVGVGASRARDLFNQAKAAAPAIIFIDELDAIGRARGGSMGFGGNDEREQTLNQILTEMDGFSGTEGVIVLAATNRPEILDPALLRPGRFDRRVTVNPPDRAGRQAILEVHTRGVPLDDGVDLAALAAGTPGMVGAELKNLVNEAAITAARRDHERVELADFTDALEKIILGAERKILVSPRERERTAYHESGHAVLGMLLPGADPVRKVSIVPRGRALGVTFQAPESDRYGYSVEELRGRIIGALGGRAAEKLIYGEITTGAESDLEQVTRIARMMVGRWGMSDVIGPVSVLPGPQDEPTLFPGTPGSASEETRKRVDDEVRRIVDECEREATALLTENRDKLESLSKALLDRETLDEADAYAAAGVARAGANV